MSAGAIADARSDLFPARPAVAWIIAVAATCFAASWTTSAFWWGFHQGAFLPLWERLLLGVFPFVVASAALVFRRGASSFGDPVCGRAGAHLFAAAVIAALTALLWFFRDTTHFLGDGILIENAAQNGSVFSRSSPLANAICVAVVSRFGAAAPGHALEILSVLLGVPFMILAWLIAGELAGAGRRRLIGFLLFVVQPPLFAYAGYIEFYPIAWVTTLAVLYLSLLAVRGALPGAVPLTAAVLNVGVYVPSIVLIPPVLAALVVARRERSGETIARASARVVIDVGLAVVAGLVLLALFGAGPAVLRHALFGEQGARFLPLASSEDIRFPYTLFSPLHFIDMLNEIILVMPLLPLLPLFLARRRGWRREPEIVLLAGATLLTAAPFFLMNATLGFARDWDLKAFPFLPAQLLAIFLIVGRVRKEVSLCAPVERFLLLFLVAFGLARTVAWIELNHDRTAALDHAASMAEEERLNAPFSRSYMHEQLGTIFKGEGDFRAAYLSAREAARLRPESARLQAAAGFAAVDARLFREGEEHFRKTLAVDDRFLPAAAGLGTVFLGRNDPVAAERWFREALRIDRADPRASRLLAVALIRQGKGAEAVREMATIPFYVRGKVVGTQLDALVRGLEVNGFIDEAATVRRILAKRKSGGGTGDAP